jgi:UDP-glucose 4-epimerase
VKRILVTGASGFLGRALVEDLAAAGQPVRAAMRQPADIFPRQVEVIAVSDLTRPVEWRALLKDTEMVVHLAGIAHAGPGIAEDAYDRVNRLATAELAATAGAIGIPLIFISSIRAQAGPTASQPLRETDTPRPTDAYGRSKLAAEDAVRASGVPFTILRPALVYGPGVRGNLARLLRLAQSPWPLPVASFTARRSLLARQNLIGAIRYALAHPLAGETFLVADPIPLTLPEIVTALRAGAGRSPQLLPLPSVLIGAMLKAMNRADEWDRLGGELVVDPGKLLAAGWRPAIETRAGLAAMAQAASPRKSGTASRNTR